MRALTRSLLFVLRFTLVVAAIALALFANLRCAAPFPVAAPTAAATTAPPATVAQRTTVPSPRPAATLTPAATQTTAPALTNTPFAAPTTDVRRIGPTYKFTERAVQVSVDGQNWQERPTRFDDQIVSLLPAITSPAVVYVLTTAPLTTSEPLRPRLRYTLWASADAALTWEKRASDEIGGCYVVRVGLQALRGWTVPPEMLSVSTQCADSPSDSRGFGMGARLSTDGGRSFIWSMMADGIEMIYTNEGILRFIPNRSGASALALSRDKGVTWRALTPPDLNVGYPTSSPMFEADEHDPAHVRLRERIGEQRVWDSYDGGHTWTRR